MKGLFLYNIYSCMGNATISLIAVVIMGIVGLFLKTQGLWSTLVPIGIILLPIGAGGGFVNDHNTKWTRYEVTMPVQRKEIISCKYLLYFVFQLIGTAVMIGFTWLIILIHQSMQFSEVLFSFALGIGASLTGGALFYPLAYKFEKGTEALLTISFLLASGLLGLTIWMGASIFPGMSFNMLTIGFAIVSLILFIASYLLTAAIYKKKDL